MDTPKPSSGFGDALRICDEPRPQTTTQAKFSLQFAVAAAARGVRCYRSISMPASGGTPRSLAAAGGAVAHRRGLGRCYPAHYGARVTLRFANGDAHTAQVTDSLGDPERRCAPKTSWPRRAI